MEKSFLDEWLDARMSSRFNLGESGMANIALSDIFPGGGVAEQLGSIDFDHNPTEGSEELRAAAAELYEHARSGEVLITAGASEAILVYFLSIREPKANVIVLTPAFHSLYDVPEALGMEVRQIALQHEQGYRLPVQEIFDTADQDTRCVLLTTPSNPMGTVFDASEVLELAEALQSLDCDILLDEQYRLLPHDEKLARFPSAGMSSPRILSVASAGKCYGTVGLRVGWIVAPDEMVDRMNAMKALTSHAISKLNDRICLELLRGGDAILANNRAAIVSNKNCFEDLMSQHAGAFEWITPTGGSVGFPRLVSGACATSFAGALYDETDVLLLPGEAFGFQDFFRIRLGAEPAVFEEAMMRMSDFLDGWSG